MWRGYERKLRPRKQEPLPYASINRRFEIALNAAAHRMLDEANYVQLFYDEETKRIGIRRPHQGDYRHEIVNAKRYGGSGRMRIVRTGRFLRKFGIEVTETLVFRSITSEEGPMLVLDLATAEPLSSAA